LDFRNYKYNEHGPLGMQLLLPSGTHGLGRPEPVPAAVAKDFARARAIFGSFELAHRKGIYDYSDAILGLKKGGQTIQSIERPYRHLAYSFSPDGQTIISGGNNGKLTVYDLKGQLVGNFAGHESAIHAVAPSPDGRLLVSGSADQTVRLWNLKTRELIVTLFNSWTPQGYYTGSPGADKIVGWQINKGPDQLPDYVGADQLRQRVARYRLIALSSSPAIGCSTEREFLSRSTHTRECARSTWSRRMPIASLTRSPWR
jgi:hypothetical protein